MIRGRLAFIRIVIFIEHFCRIETVLVIVTTGVAEDLFYLFSWLLATPSYYSHAGHTVCQGDSLDS